MGFLVELWLPILLSAVFVFVVSSILHMVIPIHAGDYGRLPNEAEVRRALRESGARPGQYGIPCPASKKEMSSPEMLAKYNEGPVGFLTLMPTGAPAIGKALIQWFLFSVVIGIFAAYVAHFTLGSGAPYRAVFRLTGTIAFLGYALSYVPDSIWKGLSWRITLKFMFDGLLYALVTAGTFGWLWPR